MPFTRPRIDMRYGHYDNVCHHGTAKGIDGNYRIIPGSRAHLIIVFYNSHEEQYKGSAATLGWYLILIFLYTANFEQSFLKSVFIFVKPMRPSH